MRIAASTYLNSAPLVESFTRDPRLRRHTFIGDAAPSRCARMLQNGACDVALIPVIEYQRIPDLRLIPEIAVASKDRVRSVVVAARRPLAEARRVALDASSRTSQTLVRLLFELRYRAAPEFLERTPDRSVGCENMFEGVDAALVIGDPAMQLAVEAAARGLRIYDLAAEWREMTGLPFVFAVWAAPADLCAREPALGRDFLLAKEEGLAARAAIAARYAAELGLPEADLLDYLRRNVNYDLDEENLAGLRRYFSLARASGLIAENRPLLFA
jgi:chorismate dehydratase